MLKPEALVNDGPVMQKSFELSSAYTWNVNGPRVSVSFSGSPGVGSFWAQ